MTAAPLVERVSAAIAQALADAYAEREEPTAEDHARAARAAIGAMREPSEAMVKAGDDAMTDMVDCHGGCMMDGFDFKPGWYAVIDAVLKGEG